MSEEGDKGRGSPQPVDATMVEAAKPAVEDSAPAEVEEKRQRERSRTRSKSRSRRERSADKGRDRSRDRDRDRDRHRKHSRRNRDERDYRRRSRSRSRDRRRRYAACTTESSKDCRTASVQCAAAYQAQESVRSQDPFFCSIQQLVRAFSVNTV